MEELIGEIDKVEPGPAGLKVHISSRHGPDPGWLDVTGVVAGEVQVNCDPGDESDSLRSTFSASPSSACDPSLTTWPNASSG